MTGYPMLDVFLSVLYFFGWVLWIMLMFWIVTDIFRSDDLSGWAKAAWLLGVIVFPLLGILVYLIARGGSMRERQERRTAAADAALRDYIRQAAATDSGTASPASTGTPAGAATVGSAGMAASAGAASMGAGNGGASTASEELAKLAGLHQRGVLNDEEFERAKSRVH